MASLSTSPIDENIPKMSQGENDVDMCTETQDGDANVHNEDASLNERDLSELKNRQFSNNATAAALEVPMAMPKQLEQQHDTLRGKGEYVKYKNQIKEQEQRNLETEEAPNHDAESCTDSPGVTSQDDDTADEADYLESAGDERIACIEEEYVQRISVLEQRHGELENVLERLTAAVECGLVQHTEPKVEEDVCNACEGDGEEKTTKVEEEAKQTGAEKEEKKSEKDISRGLIIDLFVEFQHKIRNFAEDLNGVLNCSEAAIRHARVVQEWATSVQLMFEQMKDERHKILNYIDERERNMLIVKDQFVAELEEQGRTLKQLVEEMMSHNELQQQGEDYCKTKGEAGNKRSTVEKIVDLLLKRRLEEDRSIILNLSKQSKISEMKLFIIHQQSCIQQLQEQNKELRAIIEGLMGPDDLEDEEEEDPCDTDQSGTPASGSNPEQNPLRDSLFREDSPTLSLVSDVLYCDRGYYLPGNSTDGDVATVQAYSIGRDCDGIKGGEEIVFDPLSVNYVREQCQHAEECERQAHLEANKTENTDQTADDENVEVEKSTTDQDDVKEVPDKVNEAEQCQDEAREIETTEKDSDVDMPKDVKTNDDPINDSHTLDDGTVNDKAAGDCVTVDVTTEKEESPEQPAETQSV